MTFDYNDDNLQLGSIADNVSLVFKNGLRKASHYGKEPSVVLCEFRTGLASSKPGCNPLRDDCQLQRC